MRGKYFKTLMVLILFAMCLTVLAPAMYAEQAPNILVPIKVTLDGSPPGENQAYDIIMKADDPSYPMPEGSQDGIFRFTIASDGVIELPVIRYNSTGVYTYSIYQQAGDDSLIDYDDSEYSLVVYVSNSPSGEGYDTMVILYVVGDPAKRDTIVLDNEYYEEPSPSPRPGEGGGGADKPGDPIDIAPITANLDIPQTGDDTVIWPFVALLLSGAGILLTLGFTVNKKKPEDE